MKTVKLGDVAIESKTSIKVIPFGTPIVGLEDLDSGSLVLKRWATNEATTFTKAFKKDDVLFGRRRAYLRKAAIAPFDGVCSGDITVIRAISDRILPSLLPFVIQSPIFFDHAVRNSDGSLSPRAKWASLKQFEFCLSEDKSEQQRLVNILRNIGATKASYENVLMMTDRLIKSRFVVREVRHA